MMNFPAFNCPYRTYQKEIMSWVHHLVATHIMPIDSIFVKMTLNDAVSDKSQILRADNSFHSHQILDWNAHPKFVQV